MASALEWEGVVFFFANVLDMVLFDIDCYVFVFWKCVYCLLQCTLGSCGRLVFLVTLGSGYPVSLWRLFIGMRVALDVLFWMCLIVFPFVNIAPTASMAANCEFQMLVGTSLSAAVKNCIACVILSSALMWVVLGFYENTQQCL